MTTPENTVTPAAPARRPFSMSICENAYTAFNKSAVLIRAGYVYAPDIPVMVDSMGCATFTLVMGTPDEIAVNNAQAEIELGNALEAAAFDRAVEARAKQLLDDHKREQLASQVEAMKAKAAADIAALEAQTAKAIAAIAAN